LAPDEDGAETRPGLEALLDSFQPGWREQISAQRFLPRMEVSSAIPTTAAPIGVRLNDQIFAAADWAVGGFLADGGLQAAREISALVEGSVRLSA
jgi:hypothetical protein